MSALADTDVIGYLSACNVCGQRVLTRGQHGFDEFTCAACRGAMGWGDVDVAQAEPTGGRP